MAALALMSSLVAAQTLAADDDLATAIWHPLPPANICGADRTGFWIGGGHYQIDGKLDLKLTLPPSPGSGITAAVSGPTGPVSALGDILGQTDRLSVSSYDRHGASLWTRTLQGVPDRTPLYGPDDLFVDARGDILLGGDFRGCVRLTPQGKRICSDEKALDRYDDGCQSFDCARSQHFVATFDAHGKLKSVFAPAGYPATHAATTEGRMAWAGDFTGQLDLDPDPRRTTMVGARGTMKRASKPRQAFWSLFDPQAGMRWIGGRAIVGPANASIADVTFDADGTLLLLAKVDRAQPKDGADVLTDGVATSPLPPAGPSGYLVVISGPSNLEPSLEPLTGEANPDTGEIRLLAAPTGGVFVTFGAPAPKRVDTPSVHPERTIAAVYGPAKGWRIRVPNDVVPEAVVVDRGRACIAFEFIGPHPLLVGGATVSVGERDKTSEAIGCYELPGQHLSH